MKRRSPVVLIVLLFAFACLSTASAEPRRIRVAVGSEDSRLVQTPQGAFHLCVGANPRPRCVLGSPAGNTGAALWFAGHRPPAIVDEPQVVARETCTFSLRFDEPGRIVAAVVGSIRAIRTFRHERHLPGARLREALKELDGASALAARIRAWLHPHWKLKAGGHRAERLVVGLAGRHRYRLVLSSKNGSFRLLKGKTDDPGKEILQVPAGVIDLRYDSTQKPLTPFAKGELLRADARRALDALPARQAERMRSLVKGLQFCAYHEKFLAGSWRFLTYFGRDTLLSMRMLAPVLRPSALEAGLAAVALRLSSEGEVAHEESLACQAAIERIGDWLDEGAPGDGPHRLAEPTYDRKMVDDDFLVLPLLSDYHAAGGRALFRPKSPAFLPLLRNVNRVLRIAMKGQPVEIEAGFDEGDWRDSQEGLGGGRFPGSVNCAHCPAALEALAKLLDAKVWRPDDLTRAATTQGLHGLTMVLRHPALMTMLRSSWASMWKRFHVTLADGERLRRQNAYRASLGFPRTSGPAPFPHGFLALSLRPDRSPVPVVYSDILLMLMDLPLSDSVFDLVCTPFETDFPEGLMSTAGLLVSSPSMTRCPKLLELYDRHHYHGAVVWSWPQVFLEIALLHRLGRWFTPAPERCTAQRAARLKAMLARIGRMRKDLESWTANELWTWKRSAGGKIVPTAYGQEEAASTESNAVQLWSVASLGLELWLHR